jgi:uncharacterized protein (TIRG00374 family)
MILLITVLYCTAVLPRFREVAVKALLCVFRKVRRLISRKSISKKYDITVFLDEFRAGLSLATKRPSYLLKFIGITIIDYTATMAVMYTAFRAMGCDISLWYMILGVTIGHVAGTVSMLPGGLGAMEGSLALVYTAFGVSIEVVLGAALIYRVAFNIVPFLFSIPLYLSMKKKETVV